VTVVFPISMQETSVCIDTRGEFFYNQIWPLIEQNFQVKPSFTHVHLFAPVHNGCIIKVTERTLEYFSNRHSSEEKNEWLSGDHLLTSLDKFVYAGVFWALKEKDLLLLPSCPVYFDVSW
jgi:hypothetical protein